MAITVGDIATALDAAAEGDLTLPISGAAEPAAAKAGELAMAMSPKYAEALPQGAAEAALLWEGADWQAMGLKAAIFVTRPRLAMAGLTKAFDPGPAIAGGIHPTAVIDPTASIGANPAIGPLVVVGPGAVIGDNARLAAHVVVGEHARIGDHAMILSGVRIGSRVTIGDRFIAQSGAVIGADGMSFVTPDKSNVEKVRENVGQADDLGQEPWVRIHSLGAVTVGNDVEIGANACIDKGTIRDTRIGNGTKIDNLVHIAHNVVIGENCLFAAQVGIAGSTKIGDRVVFGGQCGVGDNLSIGSDVVAGGASKMLSNVPSGRAVLGYPAVKMETHVETYKALRRLPRLFTQVAKLQKSVSNTGDKH